jgi:hypothetical protein
MVDQTWAALVVVLAPPGLVLLLKWWQLRKVR